MNNKLTTLYLFIGLMIDIILIALSIKFVIIPLAAISMLMFIPLMILFFYLLIPIIQDAILNDRINKNKKLNTNYSNLYTIISDGNKKHKFITEIKSKKLGLSDINFIIKTNKITFSYKYFGFIIRINIYKKYIKYNILTAKKYSNGKQDKIKIGKESINDEFLDINGLCNLVVKLNNYVDDYKSDIEVNEFLNGKLFEQHNYFKKYILEDAIVELILATLFLAIIIGGTITFFFEEKLNIIIIFILLIIVISMLISLFLGLKNIIAYKNLLKDYKVKETFEIKGKPNKVKIGFKRERHQLLTDVKYIKIYIDNHCLFIAFPDFYWIKSKINLKECINELVNTNCNFTVLKHSKVVVRGEKKFITITKSYLK